MPPKEIAPKLLSWASDLDDGTVAQAARAARMPFVEGHVALMPDAHVGIGATVGSVIPTRDAIIPSAGGDDIGRRGVAAETDPLAAGPPGHPRRALPLTVHRLPARGGCGHASALH